MSKSKQNVSAAQRRAQERQQRQERLNTDQKKQARGSRRRKAKNNPWPLIAVILVVVAIVVGVFLYLANQPAPQKATSGQGVEAKTLKTITTLDPALLATVGTGSAQNLLHALPPGASVPNGPTGKPQFMYVGADYCPYCGAQRWPIIIALSRFGTFGPLDPLTSSEDNIPTYSFHGAKYTSQYIDFVPLETTDNQGNKLDVPDATQTQLITTYNAPPYTDANSKGAIPFLLIGNKQTSTGAFYSPAVIQTLSYDEIGKQVTDPNSAVAKGMIGAANDLTAAICQVTNNQPASVCNAAPIPKIEQSLPKAAVNPGGAQSAIADAPSALVTRRRN